MGNVTRESEIAVDRRGQVQDGPQHGPAAICLKSDSPKHGRYPVIVYVR